jgi:hypothetical protein
MNGGKAEILRNEGLIAGPDLPPEYAAFIEELSDDEVELLINLKRRLDDAGIPTSRLELAMPIL